MANMHFYAKLLVDMLRKMLGRIYTAMLTARATETELQGGESSLDITTYMMVCQRIDMIQELQYLSIILQETDDRLVQSRQLLIWLISARVVGASTIEDITSSIAGWILWNAFLIRETEHSYHQRSLAIILRESSWSILWMRKIDILVGRLITIGTIDRRTLDASKLWQLGETAQHIHHIRIRENLLPHLQEVTKILDGRRNALQKCFLRSK